MLVVFPEPLEEAVNILLAITDCLGKHSLLCVLLECGYSAFTSSNADSRVRSSAINSRYSFEEPVLSFKALMTSLTRLIPLTKSPMEKPKAAAIVKYVMRPPWYCRKLRYLLEIYNILRTYRRKK